MGKYFEKVKKPDVLPNWLGLLGILLSGLAILFLILDRNEKSNSEELQSIIISQLETTGSTTIEKVLPTAKEKGYNEEEVKTEFYTLVAKQILLKTSVGFEVKRFTTRLFDEIDLIILYEYSNCDGACIKSIADFDSGAIDVMCKLKEIEKERNKSSYSEDSFTSYLSGIEWYIRESFYKRGAVDKGVGFSVKANKSMKPSQENCAAD